MILDRLRREAVEQNWFAVMVELFILILGVFLGLQANNWNQARLDRAKARDYHMRLIEDLRATEQVTQASIVYYRDARAHGIAALAAFDRPPATLGLPFLNDAYQATQLYPRAGRHSTYDEVLASGNAEMLGSPELRERLANFYWRMDGLLLLVSEPPPFRDRLRAVMPYTVTSAIRTDCDEMMTDNGRGMFTPRLRKSCVTALAPRDISAAVTAMQQAPGLKQDLNRTLIDLDAKLLQFGKIKAGARQLRQVMEKRAD